MTVSEDFSPNSDNVAQDEAAASNHPLRRGLLILEALAREPQRFSGINDIARMVNLHKSTVSRLCAILSDSGYLERDPRTSRVRIGPRLFELAGSSPSSVDWQTAARPVLQRLVDATGETAHFATFQGQDLVTVMVVDSPHLMRMHSGVGRRRPFHATSMGLAILSQLPEDEVDLHLGPDPLAKVTPKTETDRRRIREQLAEFRRQGYALDIEGIELGLHCVGAAIRGPSGAVIGAVSVSGPAFRMTMERIPEVALQVTSAAAQISARIGAPPAATGAGGSRALGTDA